MEFMLKSPNCLFLLFQRLGLFFKQFDNLLIARSVTLFATIQLIFSSRSQSLLNPSA